MKRDQNTRRLLALLALTAAAWGCGGNDNTLPLNDELLGTYQRVTYWKNLNICTGPEFELDLAEVNDFVRFQRQSTDIGDYMSYRNCSFIDERNRCCAATDEQGNCVVADVELLYAELRNKNWLAKRRVAIQYADSCALQFIQSTISRGPQQRQDLLRMDTFTYSGTVERPEGTNCNAAMAEEMFTQFDCIAHTDSFIERVTP